MGQGTSAPSAVAGGNPRGNGHPVPLPPRCDAPLGDPTVVGVAGFPQQKVLKMSENVGKLMDHLRSYPLVN